MSKSSPCPFNEATFVSIWAQLPAAERQQILRLLAQLAFNHVIAQWQSIQEKRNVVSTEYA